jgi:hypothetical protein
LGGSGWTVNSGSVDEAYLQIPWHQLLENGCSFKLRKIRLQIAFQRPEKREGETITSSASSLLLSSFLLTYQILVPPTTTTTTATTTSTSSSISSSILESSLSWGMGSSLLFGGENLANSQFLRNSVNLQEEEEVAAVGLDVLAKTIEKIFSRVEATIEDLVLNVQFYSKKLDKWILAVLTFPFLEYVNAEQINKDLAVAKVLRIRSFNIELGEVDGPNGTSSSLQTVVNGQPTPRGETLQVRFQQKQSEGLPRQVDGSLGNIGVLLTPKTLELLLAILEVDSSPGDTASPTSTSSSKHHPTKATPYTLPQDIVKRPTHYEPMQTTPSQSPSNSVPDHEYITASEDESEEEEEEIEDEFLECEDQIYQGMLRVPAVYISLQASATTLGLRMKNIVGSYQQSTAQTMIKFAAHEASLTETREERQDTLLSFVPLEKYLLPSEELGNITSPLLFQRQTQSNIEVCVRYSQKDPLTADKEYLVLLDETHIRWDAYLLQRLEGLISEFFPTSTTLPSTSSSPPAPPSPSLVNPPSGPDSDLSESLVAFKRYTRTIINAKAPSVLIITRFPDVRPGAAKGSLREEALFIDIFQPKLQSVLFSDQSSTSIIVDFDQLRATLKNIDEGYQPPIFEAQTKNTQDEVNSPIEITINSPTSIREAASNAHQTPNPAETELFRFHATATAKTSVRLILPSSELSVTKYSWDLLNELLDVIVLPSPSATFIKEEGQRIGERKWEKEEDTEEEENEEMAREEKECEKDGEEEEMEEGGVVGPSGFALSIFFVRGKWLFKENKSDRNQQRFVYLVDYTDLSYFSVYQYLGRSLSHTIISMESASIYELLSNDSTLVIHRNPFLRPLIKKNPAFLALIQKTTCDKSARLAFSEVLFEASPNSTYASRLFNFFTDTEESSDLLPTSTSPSSSSSSSNISSPPSTLPTSSPIKKSNYFIVFNEATLRYRVPEELAHHGTSATLVLHSLDALIPIEPNVPFRTQLTARDAVLLLGKVGTLREQNMEGSFDQPAGDFFEGNIEGDYRHNPKTLVDYWKREGYRDIIHFGPVLEVAVKTGQQDNEQPKTQVSLTNHLNPLELTLCSDSLAAIHELIKSFSSSSPKITEEVSQGPKSTSDKPSVEESFPRPPGFNLFNVIDKKAFEIVVESTSVLSSLRKAIPSVFQAPSTAFVSTTSTATIPQDAVFVEDYDEAPDFGWGRPAETKPVEKKEKAAGAGEVTTSEPTVRKLVENTSMADFIIDDYIDPQGNDDPEEALRLPKGYPPSVTRFVVQDFSLAIKLHSGKEWPPLETISSTSSILREEGSASDSTIAEMDTGSTSNSSSGSTVARQQPLIKDEEKYMRIDLEKINSQMDFFGEGHKYKSRFSLLVHEVKVEDAIVQQAEEEAKTWWLSFDEEYNRDRNAVMLSIELDCVRPDFELLPHREEYRLKVRFSFSFSFSFPLCLTFS